MVCIISRTQIGVIWRRRRSSYSAVSVRYLKILYRSLPVHTAHVLSTLDRCVILLRLNSELTLLLELGGKNA